MVLADMVVADIDFPCGRYGFFCCGRYRLAVAGMAVADMVAPLNTELFFDYDQSGRRGHSKKLFKRRSILDIRKFAFSNRIVDRWNSLSECCVTCK